MRGRRHTVQNADQLFSCTPLAFLAGLTLVATILTPLLWRDERVQYGDALLPANQQSHPRALYLALAPNAIEAPDQYSCRMFEMPKHSYWATAFTPRIGGAAGTVHHMLLLGCSNVPEPMLGTNYRCDMDSMKPCAEASCTTCTTSQPAMLSILRSISVSVIACSGTRRSGWQARWFPLRLGPGCDGSATAT
eukprot:SAG11_NODE_3905_length_2156_cov_1.716578_1_plen_192_part_00